jgi:cob(I)alamin adenosyltransferase
MIHVYYGNGKGKTTAAIGLAVRAAGQGKRVYVGHFLKSTAPVSGEEQWLARSASGVSVERFAGQIHPLFSAPDRFDRDAVVAAVDAACARIRESIAAGQYDVMILDELLNVVEAGFADVSDVALMLKNAGDIELVLTGRACHNVLMECADYATQMQEVRHPFKRGIRARQGIEY